MIESEDPSVVNTAKMKLELRNLKGEPPNRENRWGWFQADVHFEGEKVGVATHNTAGTSVRCTCTDDMEDFADRFPDLPPHQMKTDIETIIRMMAFHKLEKRKGK